MSLQEECLLRLQEVLKDKNYSLPVKQEIQDLILEICELDIVNKKEQIFSIIDRLQSIDTFKINTRKQLMKLDYVQGKLTSNVFGFVHPNSKVAVVVKDEDQKNTLYHELIHLTQNPNSYKLDSKYSFCNLIHKAMKEGEAVFNELKLSEKKFSKTYQVASDIQLTLFSSHVLEYKVFLEFYCDMRNLLGTSLLQKWKDANFEGDIMLEFDAYFQKNYRCSFSKFINLWQKLLYYVCINSEEQALVDLAQSDFYKMEHQHRERAMQRELLDEHEKKCLGNINQKNECIEEIKNIDCTLNDSKLLEQEYLKRVAGLKEELKDYVHENGEDEYAIEFRNYIEKATVDDYRASLIELREERKSFMSYIEEEQEKLNQIQKRKEELKRLESFYFDDILQIDVSKLVIKKFLLIEALKQEKIELKNVKFLYNCYYYYRNQNQEEFLDSKKV